MGSSSSVAKANNEEQERPAETNIVSDEVVPYTEESAKDGELRIPEKTGDGEDGQLNNWTPPSDKTESAIEPPAAPVTAPVPDAETAVEPIHQ
mmetsp:Transcript_23765/g.34556  ORF Transcript_23765/g.34556 Transcript_23765/m.34556 type:complete len:93 (+) Transcript_23765:217-495(+)